MLCATVRWIIRTVFCMGVCLVWAPTELGPCDGCSRRGGTLVDSGADITRVFFAAAARAVDSGARAAAYGLTVSQLRH